MTLEISRHFWVRVGLELQAHNEKVLVVLNISKENYSNMVPFTLIPSKHTGFPCVQLLQLGPTPALSPKRRQWEEKHNIGT